MKWIKTSDELPEKGISVMACDQTDEGPEFYITFLYRRGTAKRRQNWIHEYYKEKDDSHAPDYWAYFPEPPLKPDLTTPEPHTQS